MSTLSRATLVLFSISCFSLPAFTQQQAPSPPLSQELPANAAPLTDARESHLVLDVVVTDKSGKPRTGLTQNDFVVRDNGQVRW
jgi:hypothetical protein